MLKLAYKNFIENKVRSMAVIITIIFATVILFMSLSYHYILEEEFYSAKTIEAENAEIIIAYSPESNTRIIGTTSLEPYLDKIDFAVGVLDLYGTATISGNVQYINLRGIKEDGFDKINNIVYAEEIGRNLRSDEIIIDKSTSAKLNLKMDDSIKISVGNVTKTFYVAKIAEDHPCFDQNGAYVIYCMENYASRFIGSNFGKLYNKIYIKTIANTNVEELISDISAIEEYSDYKVSKVVDASSLTSEAKDISMPITIVLAGCVLLAMYLIYLIINASLKRKTLFISRLKSIGASNIYISGVFIIESLFYILAGVIFGTAANFIILKTGIAKLMDINPENIFYIQRIFIASAISGVLAFLFITIPIIKVKNISIKTALVYSKNTSWISNKIIPIIAIFMIIVSIILVIPEYLDASRGISSFVLGIIGILLILPYIARFFSNIAKNRINDGTLFMAVNNFGQERMVANNLKIIFAGIVISSLIASAAMLTKKIAYNVFNGIDCDIMIRNVQGDTTTQLINIKNTEEIYDVFAISIKDSTMTINDKELKIYTLGLNPEELEIMGDIEFITTENDLIEGMQNGIALDYLYHKVYKVNIGDIVPLTISGNTKYVTVTAFYNSYQWGGRTAMISSSKLTELYDLPLYNTILCKTYMDIDTAVSILRANNGANNLIVYNKEALYGAYTTIIDNAITFANLFTILIIFVCFISVNTNIINSREEMKTAMYQMYSIGFSKKKLMLVELLEYIFIGILSLSSSLLAVPLLNGAITNTMAISDIYVENELSYSTFSLIGGCYILASLIVAFTSYFYIRKNKLLKTLKFE